MLSGQAGREINEEVFADENCNFPSSLTSQGQMHKAQSQNLKNAWDQKYLLSKVDVAILDRELWSSLLDQALYQLLRSMQIILLSPIFCHA